jgi:DNA-binding NarL/FixJ family response regulator
MRILLVDDHPLFLDGLKNLLTARGVRVVGTAHNGLEALEKARGLKPDVILMDIQMPVCDGLCATRLIKAELPEIKIVMLTTSAESEDLFESVKSGASGYLLKSMTGKAFVDALRGMQEGIPPFSPGLADLLLAEFARLRSTSESVAPPASAGAAERLTERQTELLRLVASGLSYGEVAHRLAISERTVRYHMKEIMERLHLENRSQVMAYAWQQGLPRVGPPGAG